MDKNESNREPRPAPAGLILTDEAGAILGCAAWTVREKARLGLIPHYRPYGPRGRMAFKVEDLQAYLESTRVEST
jgi:excisionase family DNA binding protein